MQEDWFGHFFRGPLNLQHAGMSIRSATNQSVNLSAKLCIMCWELTSEKETIFAFKVFLTYMGEKDIPTNYNAVW